MKVKRVISGIIMFIMVAVVLIIGNKFAVNLAVSLVALLSINEYFNVFKEKKNVDRWIGNILAISIAFIDFVPVTIFLALIPPIIILLFLKVIVTEMKTNFEDIAITLFGIIYILGFIIFIPMIFSLNNGKFLIWYLAFAAWGTDTFAYMVGMKFGKHKFTSISPKKSIEGCIGGVVGAMIVSLIYTYFINKFGNLNISYLVIIVISAALSILAQLGDLSASSIKRYVGVKDFGKLIPGHGGMLDRIDSILFIAPFAYFLMSII